MNRILRRLQFAWETNTIVFDPYKAFFLVLTLHLVAVMFALVLTIIQHSPQQTPLWVLPLCTLAGLTVMLNAGNNSASAKELFWAWIIFTTAAGALAFYGQFIMGLTQ